MAIVHAIPDLSPLSTQHLHDDTTGGVATRPPLCFFSRARRCLLRSTMALVQLLGPAAASAETLRIAVALPLSGPQAGIGRDLQAALEFALADTRPLPDDTRPRVAFSWHDDGCSAEGGLAAAKAITANADDLPFAVIGHTCASAARLAAPVYDAAGVLFFDTDPTPTTASLPSKAQSRRFTFAGTGSQGTLIGQALLAADPSARIAFIRDRTALAQSTLAPVARALGEAGRGVVLVETFAGAEKDFAALARRVKATGITHVALAAFASEAVLLVAELRKAVPALTIIAAEQLADVEFGRASGGISEGVQVAVKPDASAYPKAQDLARRLIGDGHAASRAALTGYTAFEVAMDAVEMVRQDAHFDGTAWANRRHETILGPIQFDSGGNADLSSHMLYTWRGGELLPPGCAPGACERLLR